MEDVAGWIAPAATMIAAMMTAGNFGARITGWGFVVFTIGAVAWCVVAMTTHQQNLLWSNVFLGIVDVIGIWRWLFRRARYDKGADAAAEGSRSAAAAPALFPLSRLQEARVRGSGGAELGRVVDAMAECRGGRISYVMLAAGGTAGVGETLHPVPWDRLRATGDGLETDLDAAGIAAFPAAGAQQWPERAPAAG